MVLQSCRRTVEPSKSLRRSSAVRAHLSSARVTVVTPLCTSAGIATLACPWWTLVLLWRYQTVFVFLNRLLSKHHISVSPLKLVAVESSRLFLSSVYFLSWSSSLQAKEHWVNVLCLTFLLMSVFLAFSFLSPSLPPFVSLSTSLPPLSVYAEASSPASELMRPLRGRLQGSESFFSVVCWYRIYSLSFRDTCWSREVL